MRFHTLNNVGLKGGRIVIVKRDGTQGSSFPVSSGNLTIGSSKGCDIILRGISDIQCIISIRPSASAVIKNVSDWMTTIVNGKSISTKVLNDGDIISLNKAKFRWEYFEKTETSENGNKTPMSTKRIKRNLDTKSETRLRSDTSMSNSKTRQIAVVMPQRRHTSHPEYVGGRSNDVENRLSVPIAKRRKIERVEKIDTPVLDENKKAALMLLTGRSWSLKKNSLNISNSSTNTSNVKTPNNSKKVNTGGSKSVPVKQSIAKRSLDENLNKSLQTKVKTPQASLPKSHRAQNRGGSFNTSQNNDLSGIGLLVETESNTIKSQPKMSTPVSVSLRRTIRHSSIRPSPKITRSSLVSIKKSDKRVTSTPKITDKAKVKDKKLSLPSTIISKSKRNSLMTPVLKKLELSRITKSCKSKSPSDSIMKSTVNSIEESDDILNSKNGTYSSVISSLTNALNVLNDPGIDLGYVTKTPEYQAIISKIKSVEKLSKTPSVQTPSPQLIEIGKIKSLQRKSLRSAKKGNEYDNTVFDESIIPSPIVSGKYTPPELLQSSANRNTDMSTPNISMLFESKSSTPKNTSTEEIFTDSNGSRKSKRNTRKSNASNITEDEIIITPKSTVKPPQEILKEKHSTAKKPVSKKNIIDHLTRSPDVAKALFKSPVKRVLSQSIKHYDSTHVFEDEDNNLMDSLQDSSFELLTSFQRESHSEQSPKNRAKRITRTSLKNISAKNNSSDLKGLKKLFKTPKVRRSVKNDLSNFGGIRTLFQTPSKEQKLPKNDLTDVGGVKKLFGTPRDKQASPKNDLTNVRGVKKLLSTPQKKQRSPKNDLTDVVGVKELLHNSNTPINGEIDLIHSRRLSQLQALIHKASQLDAKKLLEEYEASQKNDFTDVEVKTMTPLNKKILEMLLNHQSPKNDLTELKGVKQLQKTLKLNKTPVNRLNKLRVKRKSNDDLRDVRGVSKLFQTPNKKRNSPKTPVVNLSGIDSLFKINQSETKTDSTVNRSPNKNSFNDSITSNSILENVGLIPSKFYENMKSIRNSSRLRRRSEMNKSHSLNVSKASTSLKMNSSIENVASGFSKLGHSTPANNKNLNSSEYKDNFISISPINVLKPEPSQDKKTKRKTTKSEVIVGSVKKTRLRVKEENKALNDVKSEKGKPSGKTKDSLKKINKKTKNTIDSKKNLLTKLNVIKDIDELNEVATVVKLRSIKSNKETVQKENKKKVTFDLTNEKNIPEKSVAKTRTTRSSASINSNQKVKSPVPDKKNKPKTTPGKVTAKSKPVKKQTETKKTKVEDDQASKKSSAKTEKTNTRTSTRSKTVVASEKSAKSVSTTKKATTAKKSAPAAKKVSSPKKSPKSKKVVKKTAPTKKVVTPKTKAVTLTLWLPKSGVSKSTLQSIINKHVGSGAYLKK